MFLKDFDKFKIIVEDTMQTFFEMTPEQVKQNIAVIEKMYSSKYDLDKVDYKNIDPDVRDIILRYRTLKYFDGIYDKVMELHNFLKEGDLNGTF